MADNRSGIWSKARDRRIFAVTETTFGTQVKPSATDALRMLSGAIESPGDHRIERDDNRPSRSLEAQITGPIPPVAWSYEGYVIPSGTAGTPPDVHALLMAAMGTDSYTNTPATSDAYALTDTAQNRGSLSLYEFYPAGGSAAKDGVHMESLFGAIVSTMSISGSGGEPPKITFGGVGATHVLTGRDDVNDATPSGATITVTNGKQFRVGSVVAFYETADGTTLVDDNAAAGFKVTAVSGNDITLENSLTGSPGSVADNDIIAPWAPTETVVGTPIPGINGGLTVEGVTVSPLAYEVNLDNGDQPHDNEAFQSVMTGYHEAKRRVAGQFTYRCKASDTKVLTQRADYGNITLSLVLGTTAGSILTIAIEAEMGFASIEKAEEDTAICVCPYKGIATSANAKDELALTFT